MMTTELPEHLRNHVKTAVTHYAKFYAQLVAEDQGAAEQELESIRHLDSRIQTKEDDKNYESYLNRRSQLMRIFHYQLIGRVEGQIQQEVLDNAVKLAERLEIVKIGE